MSMPAAIPSLICVEEISTVGASSISNILYFSPVQLPLPSGSVRHSFSSPSRTDFMSYPFLG